LTTRHVWYALGIALLGLLLLNVVFLLNFFVFSLIGVFVPEESVEANRWTWFPPARHALFLVIVCAASWPILRSRLGTFFKATYLTVPVAVALATIGILLYRWPLLPYLIGGLLVAGTLYYLFRTRRPWPYYYSVILVALALTLLTLFGGEI
jgi:hypothetical protein